MEIVVADPTSPEAQACIQAYFAELQARFPEGFDPDNSVSADPQELVPPRGWLILAWLNGQTVGCGALKVHTDGTGEIKRMWVSPEARGRRIATRLLYQLEALAMQAGIDVVRLDTHRVLTQAQAFYRHHGYTEIPAYNTNPYAHHWFEKRGLQARNPVASSSSQSP